MASRPVEEQQRVAQVGVPNARMTTQANPNQFGAQVGGTLENLGLAVYSKEVREANQTAAMAADRRLSEAQTELQIKLSEMRGRDAMGAPDTLHKEWDKITQTIEKDGLYNDEQRQAFQRSAASRFDQTNRWLQGHVSQEKYKFQEHETVGYLKASQDSAALNADNPDWAREEKRKQYAVLQDWAVRNGYGNFTEEEAFQGPGRAVEKPIPEPADPALFGGVGMYEPEQMRHMASYRQKTGAFFEEGAQPRARRWVGSATFDEKVAEVHSGTNKAVIERLLNTGQDLSAKKYYDENKAEFTVADRGAVERVLEEGSYRGESLRRTRDIVGKSADLKEALGAIGTIDDPKLEQLVRAQVSQHYNDQAHATKLRQDGLYEQAGATVDQAVVQAKKSGKTSLDARGLVKPAVWSELSLGEKAALQAYADHAMKPPAKVKRETDAKKYLEFLYMSPEQRATLSLRDYHTKYRQYFDDGDQARADSDLQRAREAKPGKGAEFHVSDTQSFTDQVRDSFTTSGLVDPSQSRSKYKDAEVKMEAQFQRDATQAVEADERAKGKKLTPTERQQVIDAVKDRAVKKMWVPGRFWGTNEKPMIELSDDDKAHALVPVEKIPAADLESLKNYFLSKGKTPSKDKLARAYGQYVLGNRAALDKIIDEQ